MKESKNDIAYINKIKAEIKSGVSKERLEDLRITVGGRGDDATDNYDEWDDLSDLIDDEIKKSKDMKESIITIEQDVKVGRFILEAGDRIRVLKSISEEEEEED